MLNGKLIENLKKFITEPVTIEIHGGWVGLLASFLFQQIKEIEKITSLDIDPSVEKTANEMNMVEYTQTEEEYYNSYEYKMYEVMVKLNKYDRSGKEIVPPKRKIMVYSNDSKNVLENNIYTLIKNYKKHLYNS